MFEDSFPLYFRSVYLDEEWEWTLIGKKGLTMLDILHLFLPFWTHSSPWSLSQNYITWYPLPSGILVSTNRRHYQEKTSKRKVIRYLFLPHLSSLPPNPWFWQWLCSPMCVHYYWAVHFPQPQLSLGSDGCHSLTLRQQDLEQSWLSIVVGPWMLHYPFLLLLILPISS